MKNYISLLFFVLLILISCGQTRNQSGSAIIETVKVVDKGMVKGDGGTLQTRFDVPKGYVRKGVDSGSFGFYLRNLPLKPVGAKVRYFNGEVKDNGVYCAVVDMAISNKDLQQCADAIMRLRGEYFYGLGEYEKISFTLTNGFKVDYSVWMAGNRVAVKGNKASWYKAGEASNRYEDFLGYMDFVFTYAGTLSMDKSLRRKDIKDIAIGDVFIRGGSPGHAVIVVDVAENEKGGKVFMLAQSYMPAQETQILNNFNDEGLSPWYDANFGELLATPEWEFEVGQLKTW